MILRQHSLVSPWSQAPSVPPYRQGLAQVGSPGWCFCWSQARASPVVRSRHRPALLWRSCAAAEVPARPPQLVDSPPPAAPPQLADSPPRRRSLLVLTARLRAPTPRQLEEDDGGAPATTPAMTAPAPTSASRSCCSSSPPPRRRASAPGPPEHAPGPATAPQPEAGAPARNYSGDGAGRCCCRGCRLPSPPRGWTPGRWRTCGPPRPPRRSSAAGAAPCSGRRPSSRATTSRAARTSASPRKSTARPITARFAALPLSPGTALRSTSRVSERFTSRHPSPDGWDGTGGAESVATPLLRAAEKLLQSPGPPEFPALAKRNDLLALSLPRACFPAVLGAVSA